MTGARILHLIMAVAGDSILKAAFPLLRATIADSVLRGASATALAIVVEKFQADAL